MRHTLTQPPAPPPSAKKRSLPKNQGGKSFIEQEDDPHAVTDGQFFSNRCSKVEGNELFANTKILMNERV
jgi:hypothetical protein